MSYAARAGTPLTPELQALVAEAWGYVGKIIRRWDRTDPAVAMSGAIAIRLTMLIETFDPAKASLQKWALCQAKFAAAEHLRSIKQGYRRMTREPHRFSLCEHEGAACDPEPQIDQQDEVRAVLSRLAPRTAEILWRVEGLEQRCEEVGDSMGLCRARVFQIRQKIRLQLKGDQHAIRQ